MMLPEPETLCCVQCHHIQQPGEQSNTAAVDGEHWDECPVCGYADIGGCPSYLRYEIMPLFEKVQLLESIILNKEV